MKRIEALLAATVLAIITPEVPGAEYVVPGWPASSPGSVWREVSQDRLVPAEWVGREPIYAWEAKVYTTT